MKKINNLDFLKSGEYVKIMRNKEAIYGIVGHIKKDSFTTHIIIPIPEEAYAIEVILLSFDENKKTFRYGQKKYKVFTSSRVEAKRALDALENAELEKLALEYEDKISDVTSYYNFRLSNVIDSLKE